MLCCQFLDLLVMEVELGANCIIFTHTLPFYPNFEVLSCVESDLKENIAAWSLSQITCQLKFKTTHFHVSITWESLDANTGIQKRLLKWIASLFLNLATPNFAIFDCTELSEHMEHYFQLFSLIIVLVSLNWAVFCCRVDNEEWTGPASLGLLLCFLSIDYRWTLRMLYPCI